MYVLAMGDPVRTDFGYFGSILSGPDLEQTFLGFKADFCPDREQTFTCIIRGPYQHWGHCPTIIARVMQSPLVMQNEFPSPQNMLHCLFLLESRYMLLLSYKAIFSTKRNHPWEPIENTQGV